MIDRRKPLESNIDRWVRIADEVLAEDARKRKQDLYRRIDQCRELSANNFVAEER